MMQRLAMIIVCFALPGLAQGEKDQPPSPKSTTIESSNSGGATPSRTTETRRTEGSREVVTQTMQTAGPDGRLRVTSETTTETVRTGKGAVQINQAVFGNDAQGRRQLVQQTQTEEQTRADGSSRAVANTFVPDVNGRMGLSERQIQETKVNSPNEKQTDTSIFRPGINSSLTEQERTQEVERKVRANVTQTETTRLLRDPNGRWQTTETRNLEVRKTGAEQVEEETVRNLDANGVLSASERNVTRRTKVNGKEQAVTEVYTPNVLGAVQRSGGALELNERRSVTTTPSADGGHQRIEEVAARSPAAPSGPLTVVSRTVETRRKIGPDLWETQRQIFGLDGNGRLVPIRTEKETSSTK